MITRQIQKTTNSVPYDLIRLNQAVRLAEKTRRDMHETRREILKKLARRMRQEYGLCS